MFKASDPTFQCDADALFYLPKKAVIVSVDETGKKIIDGNYNATNWTYEEAKKKLINKYSKTRSNPEIKFMVDLTNSGFICIDIDAEQLNIGDLTNEYPVFDYCMWSTGTTKGLHCFFKLNEAHQFVTRTKKMIRINEKYEVDLITSHILMSPHENLNGMFGEYENKELEQIFTDKPFPTAPKKSKSNPTPVSVADTDEDALSVFMNDVMGADFGNWSYDKEHFRFKSSSNRCCVETNHVHSTQDHSCIYFNDGKYLQATCVGTHGTKKINLHQNKAYQLRQICGIKNADDYAMEIGKQALFEAIAQMCEETGLKEYKETKIEFEKKHAFVEDQTSFISVDNDTGQHTIRNKGDFLTLTQPCMYIGEKDGKAVKKSFTKEWLDDPERKEYICLDCFPNEAKCPTNVYNTWNKFDMEKVVDFDPYKDEGLKDLKNLIFALAGENLEHSEYLEKWIAHAIQFPDKKSGICPVIISLEGCGKGTLVSFLKRMLGNKKVYETSNPAQHVWGQFNSMITDSKIIVLNEVSKKDMSETGRLKSLITEDMITINQKGAKSYKQKFYGEFLVTTNSLDPINLRKDNRRMVILEATDKYKNDIAFWSKMHKHLEDTDTMKVCFEYFNNMDINETTLRELPKPVSEAEKDNLEANRSPVDLFQEELLTINEAKLDLKKSTLFERFTEFASRLKLDYSISQQKFSLHFKNLELKWAKQVMRQGTRYWVLDLDAGRIENGITQLADDEPAVDSDFSFD